MDTISGNRETQTTLNNQRRRRLEFFQMMTVFHTNHGWNTPLPLLAERLSVPTARVVAAVDELCQLDIADAIRRFDEVSCADGPTDCLNTENDNRFICLLSDLGAATIVDRISRSGECKVYASLLNWRNVEEVRQEVKAGKYSMGLTPSVLDRCLCEKLQVVRVPSAIWEGLFNDTFSIITPEEVNPGLILVALANADFKKRSLIMDAEAVTVRRLSTLTDEELYNAGFSSIDEVSTLLKETHENPGRELVRVVSFANAED